MKCYILLVLLGLCLAERRSYKGYQVWEVTVNNHEQANVLMDLQDRRLIDVDGSMKRSGGTVKLTVSPKLARPIATTLRKKQMTFTTYIEDLQVVLDEEWQRLESRGSPDQLVYDRNEWNTLAEINTHMMDYVDFECPLAGLECSYSNMGNSYDGRPIYVYKVGTGGNNPIIFIDATIHAREWLATTTACRIFDNLVEEYGLDAETTFYLDNYDFWIVPVGNPDGYQYSWDDDRLWRKNRAPHGCIGVDLNRNFEYNWGRQGVSHNSCAETYCGPYAGSEPETQAFVDGITSAQPRLFAYITLHTFGNYWMIPFGNTIDFTDFTPCVRSEDYQDLFPPAQAAGSTIESISGQNWDWGNSCEVIYPTTGASDDWSKGAGGVKYVFNPELRGGWFVVSTNLIQPSFWEVWQGTLSLIDVIDFQEGPSFP